MFSSFFSQAELGIHDEVDADFAGGIKEGIVFSNPGLRIQGLINSK